MSDKKNLLESLKKDLYVGRLERKVDKYGHKWTMHVLDQQEMTWVTQFTSSRGLAILKSMEAPTLAAAITEIDGVPVDDLFTLDGIEDEDLRKALERDEERREDWVRTQFLDFILHNFDKSRIMGLYDAYRELEKEHDEEVKKLPN